MYPVCLWPSFLFACPSCTLGLQRQRTTATGVWACGGVCECVWVLVCDSQCRHAFLQPSSACQVACRGSLWSCLSVGPRGVARNPASNTTPSPPPSLTLSQPSFPAGASATVYQVKWQYGATTNTPGLLTIGCGDQIYLTTVGYHTFTQVSSAGA